MKRLIAIGDIHGHYDLLLELMRCVEPTGSDQFVFLGDYIDRGLESAAVIDWLILFKKQYPHTVFLRGNHEQMLLDAIDAAERNKNGQNSFIRDLFSIKDCGSLSPVFYFLACGGQETLDSYQVDPVALDLCDLLLSLPKGHLEFMQKTVFYWLYQPFMFVHAGVDPKDITGEKNKNDAFLWQRKPLWKKYKGWDKVVVHGHTPVLNPFFSQTEINLDTGAGYNAQLTACDVLTKKIWQTAARHD